MNRCMISTFLAASFFSTSAFGITVDSIASLRLSPPGVAGEEAIVRGYYQPGDGGGGRFYYSATSNELDNGGTRIKPTSISGAGRWIRERANPMNIYYFGGFGNDSLSDRAAFQNALDANATDLFLPAGRYIIDTPSGLGSAISVFNKTVSIRGESKGMTELEFTSTSGNGLTIDNSGVGGGAFRVRISDLSITAKHPHSGTAIRIIWPATYADRLLDKGGVEQVEFRASSTSTVFGSGWTRALHVTQGQDFKVSACSFIGRDGDSGSLAEGTKTISDAAVTWDGALFPTELKVTGSSFYNWKTGIKVGEAAEGVYVAHSTFVATKEGISWTSNTTGSRPWLVVSDSHFSVFKNALILTGVMDVNIHHNYVYHKDGASSSANLIHVFPGTGGTIGVRIADNHFRDMSEVSSNAVVVETSTSHVEVTGNDIIADIDWGGPKAAFSVGVWLRTGAGPSVVSRNRFLGVFTTAAIFNQSSFAFPPHFVAESNTAL